jgi:hypothetical protein
MYNVELTINVLALTSLVFLAAMIGYAFRSGTTKKKQLRIRELRREIVYNHAQILELQKELVVLESKTNNITQTPHLNLKSTIAEYPKDSYRSLEGLI